MKKVVKLPELLFHVALSFQDSLGDTHQEEEQNPERYQQTS